MSNRPRQSEGAGPALADSTQGPRGRIVVVGAGGAIAPATARPVTPVGSVYDVIGDLATSGLDAAPDAVLAGLEALNGRSGEFVEAVRRVDPSVRLIVIASDDEEHAALEALADGFDQVVAMPPDPKRLEAAIAGASVEEPEDESPDLSSSAESALDDSDDDPIELETAPAAAPAPRLNRSTDGRAAPDPVEVEGVLGDVDLVDHLLHHPSGVADLALRMIAQESGFADVDLSEEPDDARPCVEIEPDFGYLVSERAESAEHLAPWAQWLGHWLLLERRMRDLREMAFTDDLTGAYNRRFFYSYLPDLLDEARRQRRFVTLLVFDIDDFKRYNDRYGHAAGDEILVETVKLLRSVIRPHDRVCRIGGDEFVVIFHDPEGQREVGSSHPEDVHSIASRFQEQICRHRFPKLGPEAPGTLTISGGLATFPWDGQEAESLLDHADQCALASKRHGKNAITFGPGADQVCGREPEA